MPKPYDSRTADKFVIRLPEGMREEIAERAKANGRSMNSEMVMMMRNQLDGGLGLEQQRIVAPLLQPHHLALLHRPQR